MEIIACAFFFFLQLQRLASAESRLVTGEGGQDEKREVWRVGRVGVSGVGWGEGG